MTNEDAAYIARLQAELAPDLGPAIDAMLDAMPHATDADIRAALMTYFSEINARNRETLFELGLVSMIVAAKTAGAEGERK